MSITLQVDNVKYIAGQFAILASENEVKSLSTLSIYLQYQFIYMISTWLEIICFSVRECVRYGTFFEVQTSQ